MNIDNSNNVMNRYRSDVMFKLEDIFKIIPQKILQNYYIKCDDSLYTRDVNYSYTYSELELELLGV